jgi:hypothetical protein
MTEAGPGQPNTPEQQPVQANPDEPTSPEPSAAARSAKSAQRRSNEFWLGLGGIAATLIVGIVGSLLAYSASTNQVKAQKEQTALQVKAESDRAALSFSREQRKNAYAAFLDAVATLDRQELEFSVLSPFDMKQAEDQFKLVDDAYLAFNRASSTVRLVASPDVEGARKKIRDKHNDIQSQIGEVMNAARTSHPEKATGLKADLYNNLDRAPSPLVPNFVAGAQKDLGLPSG